MSDHLDEVTALGRAAGKSVGADVRELGVVSLESGSPPRSDVDEALAARARELLREAWIGIDGDEAAQAAGRRLAERLGARSLVVPRGQKPRYHAAAVIASNFPAALLAVAERVLRDAGVDDETALSASHSLFWAAAGNLRRMSGAEARTGPVVRGDVATIRAHLDALAADPEALYVYRSLTRFAPWTARGAATDERDIAAIARPVL